tara:strand:- start:139 stop:438 length:300 start_codon:yes stop_codon:yes gene_type:complete
VSSIERIVSWIDLRSLDSRPMNLLTLVVKTCSPCSGGLFDEDVLFGKLVASCFPTLAPDGALTLLRNLLSEVKITSIVLFPLLLKMILPLIDVILGKLF